MATISKDNIILELIVRGKKFRDEIKDAKKETDGLTGSFNKLGKRLGTALAAKLTADLVIELQNLAAEMEALDQKANVVFGDTLPKVTKAAEENALAMGLTTNEYLKAAAAAQDLLVPLGFTREEASDIAVELTNSAGALSAWTNGQLSAAQVSEILNKALLGEREQLKQLGVSLSEAEVSARLAEKGQKDLTGQLLAQAKAQATLELITEKSADAQRAFAEGGAEIAKNNATLSASLRQIGEDIARTFSGVFETATSLIDGERLVGAVRATIAQISGLFSALGEFFTGAFQGAEQSFRIVQQRILEGSSAIKSALGFDTTELDASIARVKDRRNEIASSGRTLAEAFNEGYANAFERFGTQVDDSISSTGTNITQTVRNYTKASITELEKWADTGDKLAKEEIKNREKARDAWKKYQEEIKKAARNIKDLQNELIENEFERREAEIRTQSQRAIEALVGTPKQVEEQTALINQVLQRELEQIRLEANKAKISIEVEAGLESLANAEKRLELFRSRINNDELELGELTSEGLFSLGQPEDAIPEDYFEKLSAKISSEIGSIETPDGFDRFIEDLFGDPDNLQAVQDAATKVLGIAKQLTQALIEEDIKRLDSQIGTAEERVERFRELAERGNAEQLQLEEERLEQLNRQREEALARQRRLAAVEIGIQGAVSVAEAISAVIAGFSSGNAIQGVANAVGLAATLASTIIAVRNAVNSIDSFDVGTDKVERDQIANIHKDEMILTANEARQVRALGVGHKDVAKYVALGKNLQPPKLRAEYVNNTNNIVRMDKLEKRIDDMSDRLAREIRNARTSFNIDERGLYTIHQRQLKEQTRRKKMVR